MLKATKGRLLVKEIEVEQFSEGGIFLTSESNPDNLAKKAKVVASGVSDDEAEIGSIVYFNRFSGITIQSDTQKFISLKLEEIVALEVEEV